MNRMRARALSQFPTVLLTLISIIQALALELLWSKLSDSPWLWQWDAQSFVGLGTILVSFLGILLIWVIYATMVMGFVWQPKLRDSVLPFIIGIQQFLLISLIAEEFSALWLYVLASIFVSGNWVVHNSLRRARQHSENNVFFRTRSPAQARDFLPAALIVGSFVVLGIAIQLWPHTLLMLLAQIIANAIMLFQIYGIRMLWLEIMGLEETPA